jgi:hypothetical protein
MVKIYADEIPADRPDVRNLLPLELKDLYNGDSHVALIHFYPMVWRMLTSPPTHLRRTDFVRGTQGIVNNEDWIPEGDNEDLPLDMPPIIGEKWMTYVNYRKTANLKRKENEARLAAREWAHPRHGECMSNERFREIERQAANDNRRKVLMVVSNEGSLEPYLQPRRGPLPPLLESTRGLTPAFRQLISNKEEPRSKVPRLDDEQAFPPMDTDRDSGDDASSVGSLETDLDLVSDGASEVDVDKS